MKNSECSRVTGVVPGTRFTKHLEVAVPAADGQLRHLAGFDLPSHVRAIGLQHLRAGGYLDGFGDRTRLQLQVHAHRGIHQHVDLVLDGGLESGQFGLDPIDTRIEVAENVVAALIAGSRAADIGIDFGDSHFRGGYHGTRTVGYRADQAGFGCLCAKLGGHKQSNNQT